MAVMQTTSLQDCAAFRALRDHRAALGETHLRDLFADDPDRGDAPHARGGGALLDYSKNRVTDETLRLLLRELAAETGVAERRDAMFARRAHQRDRGPRRCCTWRCACRGTARCVVDGRDVVADVHEVLDRMAAFADRVRSGEWRGHTGKTIQNVVNIGIGGSDLGPAMAYRALRPYARRDLTFRFVSNVDGTDIAEATRDLDPARDAVRRRLEDVHDARDDDERRTRRGSGCSPASAATRRPSRSHFVAVSTNLEAVAELRHRPAERVRLLGLGRRPLLDGLGDRPLDDARDRPRRVPRAARRLPRDGRALPHRAGASGTCRC